MPHMTPDNTLVVKVPVDADPKVVAAKGRLKSAEIGLRGLQAGLTKFTDSPSTNATSQGTNRRPQHGG